MSYQNIPGLSVKYERDCRQRWELIKPELPDKGVVLDIGAAEGYFCKQIAEETGLLAVAIEKQKGRVQYQHRWLNDSHKGKVVSCWCSLNNSLLSEIVQTPEFIDCTLILSTLHWINDDMFLKNIAEISGKVIIEIPDFEDYKATGQKFMNRIREYQTEENYFKTITGRDVRLLGQVEAHTYPVRNLWVIEGDNARAKGRPHLNHRPSSVIKYHQSYIDGQVSFEKRNFRKPWRKIKWINGINLLTLKHFNITWPAQSWWEEQINKSILEMDLNNISGDLRINNIIVSANKINWIDLDHHSHRMTVLEDIKDMVTDINV